MTDKPTPWYIDPELLARVRATLDEQRPKPKPRLTRAAHRDPAWNGLKEKDAQNIGTLLRVALDHCLPAAGWRYSLIVWSHRPGDQQEAVDYTAASNFINADGSHSDTIEWLREFLAAYDAEQEGE